MYYIKSIILFSISLVLLCASSSYADPGNIGVVSNVAYGNDQNQSLDIYLPPNAKNAPVIFMVHGGAWRFGDKASNSVIKNKVSHWVSKGFIFISINYRMLPDVKPIRQVEDVANALRFSQQNIHQWGGSAQKFILMGHSAGAHLVALLSSKGTKGNDIQLIPWLGTVALDSAAYNIVKIMQSKRPPLLYKRTFGNSINYWKKASPLHALSGLTPPFLAVCSQKRNDGSCEQAQEFIHKASRLKISAKLLAVNLSHRKINTELGKDAGYTKKVDDFIKTLHPSIKRLFNE